MHLSDTRLGHLSRPVGASPARRGAERRIARQRVGGAALRPRGEAAEALNLALFLRRCLLLVLRRWRLRPSYALYVAPQLLLIGRPTTFSPLMATARDVLAVLLPTHLSRRLVT